MKKATMKDIAKLANVSVATVSYVLNDVENQTIPEQTRSKILKLAKELNYIPNLAARSLIKRKSGLVGILMHKEAQSPYWKSLAHHTFIHQLERLLTGAGYHTLLISLDVSQPSLDVILERKLDAVFLIDVRDDMFYDISSKFTEGIPLILVDSLIKDKLFNQILFDYEAALKEALKKVNDISSTILVMEQFYNQALGKEIQLLSGLPAERICIAKTTEQLDDYIAQASAQNVIVLNEFIGSYLYQTHTFQQVVVICTCQLQVMLPEKVDKVLFAEDKSTAAFELMKLLTENSTKQVFKSNKFLIKVKT